MEQETVEERFARLEARTSDHGQQVAYLEGYLGAGVDRRHLQPGRGIP
jgi:hypothetical protein